MKKKQNMFAAGHFTPTKVTAEILMKATSLALLLHAGSASADQFHYNNVILGERAVGLGGAYTAVADDASGVYYNPGGLAFALSNDISGSANAFYSKKVVYKKIKELGDKDFTETAGGTFAPFFGVLQKLDKYVNGLVGAFAYYTSDTELKDQNDLYENVTVNAANDLERYHRSVQHRAATTNISAAAGFRVSNSISVGAGLNYIQVSELTQEYQDTQLRAYSTSNGVRGAEKTLVIQSQNVRQYLGAHGIEASIGVQAAVTNTLTAGLTLRKGTYVSQGYETSSEVNGVRRDLVTNSVELPRATVDGEKGKHKKPLGTMPGEARVGVAWFASTRFLWTMDVSHRESAQEADKILVLAPLYDRRAVTNIATGAEYYVLPSLPVRFGLFTNNDSRKKVEDVNKALSVDHIDYIGESLFIAWVQPNSQIALGTVMQQGSGKARKVANSANVQDVEASSWNIGFSATHSF